MNSSQHVIDVANLELSGLIKLLHPDGEVTKEELREYVEYAMEMRRRVKEQLKKMGGLEYWNTSFSYFDLESGQETFVRVPELGGGSLISEGTLAAGSIYTIGTDDLAARSPILYMRLLYDFFGYPDYNAPEGTTSPTGVAPVLEEAVEGAAFMDQLPVSAGAAKGSAKYSRQIDYEEHQRRCKRIGDRGEKIVFELEQSRLRAAGKRGLAGQVDQVSERDDSLGYDILSFDEDGTQRLIEVKATTARTLDGGFFISANELQKAKDLPNYYIYFVFCTMTRNPRIFALRQPALNGTDFKLDPVAYHITPVAHEDKPHLVVATARVHAGEPEAKSGAKSPE